MVEPANAGAVYDWLLVFYLNDYTPTRDSVKADFAPAPFGGGATYSIQDANWTVAQEPDGTVIGQCDETLFLLFVGPDPFLIYGYLVYGGDDPVNTVVWAERFDVPRLVDPEVGFEFVLRWRLGPCGA